MTTRTDASTIDRVSTAEIMVALRERYAYPEFAFFEEVGDAGSRSTVYADGVAMNMWLSRGYALSGFEVKSSRSDWLRELKQPTKAEPIIRRCDHFYLVAPGYVYQPDEVPPSWGILDFKEGKLREKRRAPQLEAEPVTRQFVSQMLRRASSQEARDIKGAVDKALADDRAQMETEIQRRVESETRALRRDTEKYKAICEALGSNEWTPPEEIIEAVRVVLSAGIAAPYSHLKSTAQQLRYAAERIEKAVAPFQPTESA